MLSCRADFPIFRRQPELVYLDSAATAQKPQAVIDAVRDFYEQGNANVHRGLYPLSVAASAAYEGARADVTRFIGAAPEEVVFTRGATEAINLLADALTRNWAAGDAILLSELEHHANLVPWQQAAERHGLELCFAKLTPAGEIDLDDLQAKLDGRVRLVALSHCSNVLGTITPVAQVKKLMAEQGSQALLLVDAAQSVAHLSIDVVALGCDFLAFSGHKLYGPSGIGVLWGRKELLDALPPYQTGGDMVKTVTPDGAIWNDAPWKFEAGTPNMEGAVGLGAAVRYLEGIDLAAHSRELSEYAQKRLAEVPEVRVVGRPALESGIISFTVDGLHPHDLAQLLGERGICIRAGHHCAAPLHATLGLAATARISFGLYNETTDVDAFIAALTEIIEEVRRA